VVAAQQLQQPVLLMVKTVVLVVVLHGVTHPLLLLLERLALEIRQAQVHRKEVAVELQHQQ